MSHKNEAERNYADDAGTNDGRVITWGLQDIAERLDRLAEAQEAANELKRIELLETLGLASDLYEDTGYPALDSAAPQLKPRIAAALGIGEDA